jgi:hypothetical protein
MPWYRCQVRGEHLPNTDVGARTTIGIFATKYIEAPDPRSAEEGALEWARATSELAEISQSAWTEKVVAEAMYEASLGELEGAQPRVIAYEMDV